MNGKRFLTALVMFAAGIALIVMHNRGNILDIIVMVLGVALVIPGLFNVAVAAFSRKAEKRAEEGSHASAAYAWTLVASVFCVIVGIAVFIVPGFFVGFLAYLFAALLIAGGFWHIMAVSYLARPFVLPFYFYIVPLLMIAAGFVIMFTDVRTITNVVVLIMGIGMVASAVNTLLEYIGTHPSRRREDTPKQVEESTHE